MLQSINTGGSLPVLLKKHSEPSLFIVCRCTSSAARTSVQQASSIAPATKRRHSAISPKSICAPFRLFLGLMFFCCIAISSFAQTGGSAGAFSRLGFGPRGMAMGNALISVHQEGIYSYYNPALSAFAQKGNQIDLATSAMSFDRRFHTANGTFRLPPSAGVTLSAMNALVTDIDGRSLDGYDTGTLETQEYQLAAAFGLQIKPGFTGGIGLKYYIADYHSDLSTAISLGLDLGVLYKFSDQFQLGIVVRDLLASYRWSSGGLYGDDVSGSTDDFPTQFHIGISYYPTPELLFSLETGRTKQEHYSHNSLRWGTSYDLHERVTVRAGYKIEDLTALKKYQLSAGFSVHLPFDFLSPSVDYAFIQEDANISYMHTFGLQLNL